MPLVEVALTVGSYVTGFLCGLMAAKRHERIAFVLGVFTVIATVVNMFLGLRRI